MHHDFLNLYDSHFDDVYRYVYFKVGNKWDADDIVSEIFRKACEKYHTIKGNPKAWLFSITRNTIIDFYRKKKELSVDLEDLESSTYSYSWANSPEESLESIELKKALSSLNKEELEIINLKCFADLTYKNIAEQLNKSESAVKIKFSRIIKKLRNIMNEKWRDCNEG